MKRQPWMKSQLDYGHELIHCVVEGARSARSHALADEPVRAALARSARASLPWAAMGASVILLALCSPKGSKFTARRAVLGVIGGVIGFSTGIAYSTRQVTREMVHGARNINSVRDLHWLAKHPIDYA